MMTIEELAKHWNVSFDEAKNISDFMNKTFFLTTAQKTGDKTFYGVIYETFKNGVIRPAFTLSADSAHGFKTEKEAARALNKARERIIFPEVGAQIRGVPRDAFIALKRIELPNDVEQKRRICSAALLPRTRGMKTNSY